MVECEVHSQDLNEDVDLIDFPKISIPNRASAAKFATNPTVACPLKYGVSKLTTAIFAVKG
jgi:hypothetical protein